MIPGASVTFGQGVLPNSLASATLSASACDWRSGFAGLPARRGYDIRENLVELGYVYYDAADITTQPTRSTNGRLPV